MNAEPACLTCHKPMNAGEAKVFTVCDECWDDIYSKAAGSAPNKLREDARLRMYRERATAAESTARLYREALEAAEDAFTRLYQGVMDEGAPPEHRSECARRGMEGVRAAIAAATSTPPATPLDNGMRPEVLTFAWSMEAKLRENDHKGGWRECTLDYLMRRLREEVTELSAAFPDLYHARSGFMGMKTVDAQATILREAADVANFAMMIADVCGAIGPNKPALAVATSTPPATPEKDTP